MSAAFAPHGWIIAQAAPFDDDDWPYQAYAGIVDYTMLMAYDEADDPGRPAPSPAQDWYEKTLDKRMRELPADSTIVALGSYGYDWVKGEPGHHAGTSPTRMVAARDAGANDPVRRRHQQSAFLL